MTRGYSLFEYSSSEKVESKQCRICGCDMEVERNIPAAGGFAAAMAHHPHAPYDRFVCRNYSGWHTQAAALIIQAEDTPSATIKKIMLDEAKEIVRTKQVTLPRFKTRDESTT